MFIGINIFVRASSEEVINLWYESELASIQQGNVLSSVTKLQRSLSKSVLIKSVKVIDNSGRELINFSNSNDKKNWLFLKLNTNSDGLKTYNVNFYKHIHTFANGNLRVFILTSSTLPLYFGIGIGSYLLILFILFGFFIRKEIINEEKIKSEKELIKIVSDLESREKISSIAAQVSHDIRSPLASLNMIIDQLDNIPENYRIIIKSSASRINDIANNLLTANRSLNSPLHSSLIGHSILLGPILDSLASEKRFQYINKNNLIIHCDLNHSYGIFTNINPIELNRILSNLINNSVESLNDNGEIIISLVEDELKNIISISDNGRGIPANVLKNLGSQGVTYGKENGSGLGIYHAKLTLISAGGDIEIISSEGQGTTINIFLPKVTTPNWFTPNLLLYANQRIIILDDDENIHHIWTEKLKHAVNNFNISIFKFKNGIEFTNFIKKQIDENFLCLMDYELIDQELNGLELIIQNNLAHKSIIISSRYDEQDLREKAQHFNIKLIPKGMTSLVPVRHAEILDNDFFEYIQIEDDELLRLTWESIAKKKNIRFLSLRSTHNFYDFESKIDKNKTSIYIDSILKDDIKGEDFAEKLHNEGYKKVFLASGFEASKFSHLPWLMCTGKECPFK